MSKKYDDPRCHITHRGTAHVHRVTNQPDDYEERRPHRSAWVCGNRACVLDARAWVERGTGETAHVRPARDHECDLCEGDAA